MNRIWLERPPATARAAGSPQVFNGSSLEHGNLIIKASKQASFSKPCSIKLFASFIDLRVNSLFAKCQFLCWSQPGGCYEIGSNKSTRQQQNLDMPEPAHTHTKHASFSAVITKLTSSLIYMLDSQCQPIKSNLTTKGSLGWIAKCESMMGSEQTNIPGKSERLECCRGCTCQATVLRN